MGQKFQGSKIKTNLEKTLLLSFHLEWIIYIQLFEEKKGVVTDELHSLKQVFFKFERQFTEF